MRLIRWLFLLALFATSSVYAEERGLVVVRDQAGKQVGLYRQSHALLVGISNYTAGWPDLESVPGELKQIERVLRAQGFTTEKVSDPDADQLWASFKSFIDRYGFDPNNRLLFYFAGHGYTRQETKGYLVPADAPDPRQDERGFLRKSLDMAQIIAWTRRIEAKHALFLFDSCFSGTVFKQRALPDRPPHITALTSAPVRQFITAGSAGETVPAESVFAPAFVDAIEHRLADLDQDGFVTGTELGVHLQAKVPKHANQTPQFGKHPDYKLARGDFVFEVGASRIPPKTRKSARLTVRSNVVGDTFYVNEQPYGPTGPSSIELTPGEHRVRVEKDGYAPWEERVILGAGERRTLQARLTTTPDSPSRAAPAGDSRSEPMMVADFTWIEGGCFQMGSPAGEQGREEDERRHRVCVEDLWLAKHEVTVSEFRRFVQATGYRTEAERADGCRAFVDGEWKWDEDRNWRSPGFEQYDRHPVVCVSWNDAQAYIDWLNREAQGNYRLPTEAEWEYAARAKTQTARFWGKNPDDACRYANVGDEQYFSGDVHNCRDGYHYTAPVGRFKTNGFGLYDMLGNVYEWTCSVYDAEYGGAEKKCPNKDISARRVIRGGSWHGRPLFVRSANRTRFPPGYRHRYFNVGFRLARTP
jgi:formylglycine-generating enzyme required for sulfatase activity